MSETAEELRDLGLTSRQVCLVMASGRAAELLKEYHRAIAKGKSVTRLSLKKDKPSDAELKKLMIGPSGNLRAPTIRKGKKLFVGFHEDSYAQELA